MPASGNVTPDNPDLARFGVGPSAQKQTPVAGVGGRASDPPRCAFVRRLETVMWRENAVHVEALAGHDGRSRTFWKAKQVPDESPASAGGRGDCWLLAIWRRLRDLGSRTGGQAKRTDIYF
jgi:hypothetical protein